MKFTCTKENLQHALDLVCSIAGKSGHLPILSHVFIKAEDTKVTVVATNLEIAMRVTVRAKVDTVGEYTVPSKMLQDTVRLFVGDQILLERVGEEMVVSSGSTVIHLKGVSAEEYPVVPEAQGEENYTLLAAPLAQSLARVVSAVSRSEVRPELSGVFWQFFGERHAGLLLAATDSYRLAEQKMSVSQGDKEFSAIIPGRTALEMLRILGQSGVDETQVRVLFSPSQCVFRYGTVELVSRLIEGKYPEYAVILPKTVASSAVLAVEDFTSVIKGASVFTVDGVQAVSITLLPEDGAISVTSGSREKGNFSSQVDAEVTGENYRYILDGVGHGMKDVVIGVNGSDQPCSLREKGKDDFVYIIMPIRQ
jgi:DNA polymerase III subunit beta